MLTSVYMLISLPLVRSQFALLSCISYLPCSSYRRSPLANIKKEQITCLLSIYCLQFSLRGVRVPQEGSSQKLCESIIEKEWHVTTKWHYTNRLILRGSKESDATRNVIEYFSCKDDCFLLKVLPYTTRGGEYQMTFEEIIKDDDEEISEIIQDMFKVNDPLSHIQCRKSFPTGLMDVFRALCVSICAKEVPVTSEWN